MKKHFLLILSIFLFLASCQKDKIFNDSYDITESIELKTKRQVNERIIKSLGETGEFKWDYFNLSELWDTHKLSDNISIFYWDHKSTDNTAKDVIINTLLANLGPKTDKNEIILKTSETLKYVILKVDYEDAFTELYNLDEVVTIEPYYDMFSYEELKTVADKFDIIEEPNSQNTNRTSNDTIPAVETAFYNHDIPLAWSSGMSGFGVRVAVIDNGIDQWEDPWFAPGGNLNGNNPNSMQRNLRRYGYYDPYPTWQWWLPPNDGYYRKITDLAADHGSSMLKTIAAPLGNATGVAYNADVSSFRSSTFMGLFTTRSLQGVADSFEKLLNSSSTKVISMSQGSIIYNEAIYRAIEDIYYHQDSNKQKLIVTAGGTFPAAEVLNALGYVSFGQLNREFTLFPARTDMVVSATGIKKTNNIDSADWCWMCFGKGDFVVEFDGDGTFSGGSSSVSTAMTAGMAALIWAEDLSQTRQEVLDKMRLAADNTTTQSRHPRFGFGRIKMSRYLNPNPNNSQRVYLRGNNNKFVSSENGSTNGMSCNRSNLGSWEKFTIVDLPNGKIALKGNNGKYVSSENGLSRMKCNRNNIGDWEEFTLINLPDGKVALKGSNGLYVSSENGATRMRCNRLYLGSQEKFTLTYF